MHAQPVAAKPRVRPELDSPVGKAQLPAGNQRSMLQLMTGKTGAWVMPTRNRTVISETRIIPTDAVDESGTKVVTMVNTVHKLAIRTRLLRGPNWSPM